MSSRIEQLIDEIEAYIDNCKYKAFSTDVIMVSRLRRFWIMLQQKLIM